jgi:lipopolysaccharide/colanic/teichoic acid biosynthesis glycosyltransferase
MQAIVIRERGDNGDGGAALLRYALSASPLNRVLLEGLDRLWRGRENVGSADVAGWTGPRDAQWILPPTWRADVPAGVLAARSRDELQADRVETPGDPGGRPWMVVTDGRFATCVNHRLLAKVLAAANVDVVAVNAVPSLLAYQERVRLTPDNELVGYRRMFADSAVPMPMPAEWPHHLFVSPKAFEAVVRPNLLAEFPLVLDRCRAAGLTARAIALAGTALDLACDEGILAVCGTVLKAPADDGGTASPTGGRRGASDEPRLIGPVKLGDQVTIEPGAVIVGPAILCDGCVVRRDAVVDASIVGANVSVESGRVLRSCLAVETALSAGRTRGEAAQRGGRPEEPLCVRQEDAFRTWPRFSYPGGVKRIVDIGVAALVLALFMPVIPVIALAVKLSSPGPVFFRDKRQGFHGKLFDCIKFRTMRQGADKMQDKLRFVCEVDGPQFKMADDPRITAVGRFLRETYLDEIPQFYNVLCGQMSVVGPRPSPESENTLCASWRDARLSVRPGITGLWQVCRTRVAHKDFQEWIHFDTKYVRDISLGQDLWICWRTFRRMVQNFVNQF